MVKSVNLYNNFNIKAFHKNSIILIGNFDGLHLGHQKLFALAKKYKKKYSLKIGVLTFEPMPKMYFNKKLTNFRISNLKQKINHLRNLNVDFIIKKSTLSALRLSTFCCKLDILKLSKFLLKNIFGIGSKVNTPIFEEYFFLYFLANENNF